MPGSINVTEPGASATCLFRGSFDALHLSLPNELIEECAAERPGSGRTVLPSRATPVADTVLYGLANALVNAEHLGASLAAVYADSVGLAIAVRLLSTSDGHAATERPRVAPLLNWRLKRATEYIEANLSEPMSLADMAASTGLTRMHFAAQFRAATGLPAHEYLLRRRVNRAQEMLARTQIPVVEVALQVGFQTQAHFTTVFKRFAGYPPHTWRRLQLEAA